MYSAQLIKSTNQIVGEKFKQQEIETERNHRREAI